MHLAKLTRSDLIFPDLPGSDAVTVLRAMADRLAERGVVDDGDELFQRLWEREKLGSTGIGSEVAIPHCKMPGLRGVVIAVATCPQGVEFGACDDRPVRVVFTVVSPTDSAATHLRSLAAISKWVRADRHIDRILAEKEPEAIVRLLEATAEPAETAEGAGGGD